jgi:hypothetical protein
MGFRNRQSSRVGLEMIDSIKGAAMTKDHSMLGYRNIRHNDAAIIYAGEMKYTKEKVVAMAIPNSQRPIEISVILASVAALAA